MTPGDYYIWEDDIPVIEEEEEPRSNDGRTSCYWCGGKLKKVSTDSVGWTCVRSVEDDTRV
jgi:hypothetical protein